MTAGKILVVDDLPDWRTTLSGLLIDQGYDVQAASSADNTLEILESEYFHVVILDVRLDETDEDNRAGLVLLRQIKKRWPSVQVIILTGYADVNMAQEALNADCYGNRLAYAFVEKDQISLLLEYVAQAYENSIRTILAKGEQENVEFKSSIRWDYKNSRSNKRLQKNILKAIAGMMNNKGGILLIGVDDDGNILGIEKDLQTLSQPTRDKAELLLTTLIQSSLGLEYIKYVDIRFETIDEKMICVISIEPSASPVFLKTANSPEFLVRVRNSTRQLNVKDATAYIIEHWENKHGHINL